MTQNQLAYLQAQETARHNAAMEQQAARELSERERSNRTSEDIKQQGQDLAEDKFALENVEFIEGVVNRAVNRMTSYLQDGIQNFADAIL